MESISTPFEVYTDGVNNTHSYPELLGWRNKETHTVPEVVPVLKVERKF